MNPDREQVYVVVTDNLAESCRRALRDCGSFYGNYRKDVGSQQVCHFDIGVLNQLRATVSREDPNHLGDLSCVVQPKTVGSSRCLELKERVLRNGKREKGESLRACQR